MAASLRAFFRRRVSQIEPQIFHIWKNLMPFGLRFDVHRPDFLHTLAAQIGDQMAADKTASTTNDDFCCIHKQGAQGSAMRQYFKRNVSV